MTEANPPDLTPRELTKLFYNDPRELGLFEQAERADCPVAYQKLLAHSAHMTVTVEKRHGELVDVEVVDVSNSDEYYQREILLRRQSDQAAVQYGIVRIDLDAMPPVVREKIVDGQVPLGRILIENNVLRSVRLVALWKAICGPVLANHFQVAPNTITYGRTARILVDQTPAIELLEIVAPEE